MSKIVFITGGSRGIGAEAVKLFAQNNCTVIFSYNKNRDLAIALQDELRQLGHNVFAVHMNLCDVEEIESVVNQIYKLHKKIDVLVNNAGVSTVNQVQDVTEELYDLTMDTNSKGAFFVTKCVVGGMLSAQKGKIVNLSSIWGRQGASCESVYSMSKFALVGLTLSLHEELFSSGICVNCICPPLVLTDMSQDLTESDMLQFAMQYGNIVTAKQVAEVIYNTSTDSKSGQIIEM